MAQIEFITFSLLATAVCGLALLVLLVVAWAFYLEAHEHNTAGVRSMLLTILVAATLGELVFSLSGLTQPWVTAVMLIVNVWGWLDALLRLRAVHDAISLFTAKQLLLLVAKTLSYAFGIIGLRQHLGKFVMLVMMDIWGLPVLYLMALPIDPAERAGAASEDKDEDVDLLVRLWRMATCKKERKRWCRSTKKLLHKGLFALSQRSAVAKVALCATSPTHRRAWSKGCRSI